MCGKVFAASSDAYTEFRDDVEKKVESLKKSSKKQIIKQVKQIKTEIDKNIKKYEKLTENVSLESESKDRDLLEQFNYLDITLEPTMALINAKKQDKVSCEGAKNRTEIEDGLGKEEDHPLSNEAKIAMSIIKAVCM